MNFRSLRDRYWAKKAKVEEEPDRVWTPPSAAKARRRLMVLWANSSRAYFEHEGCEEVEPETLVAGLSKWVVSSLRAEATIRELERHARPWREWTEQEVINGWWNRESAAMLQWALGIDPILPPWDVLADWNEIVEELEDFPDPDTWQPILTLREADAIEYEAKCAEARYWRIRTLERVEDHTYARKLMGRAKVLGQVELATDGDLALSEQISIVEAPKDKLIEVGSICMERLHALNWLCGQEEGWDDITCDTMVGWLWDENWKP